MRNLETPNQGKGNNSNTSNMATVGEIENMLAKLNLNKNTRCLEPGVYLGLSTENASDWLNRFENYCVLNSLEKEKKIMTFQLLLKGASSCWFNGLSDEDKKDYKEIIKQFKLTFMNKSKQWINTHRLETRKLEPGESCECYINEIVNIANQIGLTEKETTQTLIRGLPTSIRAQIIAFNPTTMDETIQRIYLAEATLKLQKTEEVATIEKTTNSQLTALVTAMEKMNDNLKRTTESGETRNTQHPFPDTYRRTYFPTREDNSDRRDNRTFNQRTYQQQPYGIQRRQQWNGEQMNNKTCYNCGSRNHFYRQCPNVIMNTRGREQLNPYGYGQRQRTYVNQAPTNYQNRYPTGSKNTMFPRRT